MALKSTWSDEEFDSSQEDDNFVSNQILFSSTFVSSNRVLVQGRLGSIATDIVFLSIKSNIVATNSKTTSNNSCSSDSDSGDESEKDDESLQEAYEKMYS